MVYYIVNALAILLNGALVTGLLMALSWGGVPVAIEVHKKLPFIPEEYVFSAITIACLVVFIGIGLSPVVDMIMRYVKGYREMLRDEKELFEPAFREVVAKAGKDRDDFKVYVTDGTGIESDSLGFNNLSVSRKLLKGLDMGEIAAAAAHEVGHLDMGHGVHIRVFFAVNVLGQLALWLTKRCLIVFKNIYNLELPVISWLGIFGFGTFRVIRVAIEVLLILPLLIGAVIGFRQNEYAADKYVIGLGYGEALHSYLLKMLDDPQTESKDGRIMRWVKRMIWPGPGKRLVEVEKLI